MIKTLVRKLETKKDRFSNYGDLISKILIRKPEDVEWVLENLLVYLDWNKKTEVLDLEELPAYIFKPESKILRFLLTIRFKCSVCNTVVEERTNLNCTWQTQRFKEKGTKVPICEGCIADSDKYREYGDEEVEGDSQIKKFRPRI